MFTSVAIIKLIEDGFAALYIEYINTQRFGYGCGKGDGLPGMGNGRVSFRQLVLAFISL